MWPSRSICVECWERKRRSSESIATFPSLSPIYILFFSLSFHFSFTMGRSPCCEKDHTNKGAWSKEEDDRLTNYINIHGEGCWRSLPKAAGNSSFFILILHFPQFHFILSYNTTQVCFDVAKAADLDGLITLDLISREVISLPKKMNSSLASTLSLVTSMFPFQFLSFPSFFLFLNQFFF